MRSTALFIVISSLIGFACFYGNSFYRFRPVSPLVSKLPGLPLSKSDASSIWIAMVTGEDRFIAKDTKKIYFQLGLGHLFTPSGTHLSTLGPIIKALPFGRMLYIPIGLLALLIPGLIPLARVAWIKSIQGQRHGFGFFSVIMLVEGILYSWALAPMSWLCSWLFLGLTYFAPKKTLLLWYVLGQMLLTWVFHQKFSFLSPLTAFLFGIPLALLFPIIFFSSLFPWTFFQSGVLFILEKWHRFIMLTAKIHLYIPTIELHFGHLLLMSGLLMISRKYKTRLLGLILLLLSSATGNWNQSRDLNTKWEIVPSKKASIIDKVYHQNLIQTDWSDGTSCKEKLENGIWLKNCRTKRRPGKRNKKLKKLSLKR